MIGCQPLTATARGININSGRPVDITMAPIRTIPITAILLFLWTTGTTDKLMRFNTDWIARVSSTLASLTGQGLIEGLGTSLGEVFRSGL